MELIYYGTHATMLVCIVCMALVVINDQSTDRKENFTTL